MTSEPSAQAFLDLPRGATWRRVDLHLHSPAVANFRGLDGVDPSTKGGREQLLDAYIEALVENHVEVGAITDYNGIRGHWFVPLRERAAAHGIRLLPGVEMSFNAGKRGLHVLAIFDDEVRLEGVDALLQSLSRNPTRLLIRDDGTHNDIEPKTHIIDALRELRDQFDCLLIPAHPQQDNGLLKSFQAKEAARIVDEVRFDAIEHCSETGRQQLRSTGRIAPEVFEQLAFVEFSDPKSIEEIANKRTASGDPRATYLKLSATDLAALRLALHDPETRLHVGHAPRGPIHPRVLGMEVKGSGFLAGTRIHWNADLNTLVGGRGTGKSAIIETLRYALNLNPYGTADYHDSLVAYALGSGGRVTVMVERPSAGDTPHRYVVSRVLGETPTVFDVEAETFLDIDAADVFGPSSAPLVFGQREIQTVASNPRQRLALIDDLIGEEARRAAGKVRAIRTELEANANELLGIDQRLARRPDHEQQLQRIVHEIAIFENEGVAEKLRRHTDLTAQDKRLDRAHRQVGQLAQEWHDHGADLDDHLAGLRADLSRQDRTAHADLLNEAASAIDDLRSAIAKLQQDGADAFAATQDRLGNVIEEWRDILASHEDELNRLRQELHSETLDPDRLLKLTAERSTLEPLVAEYDRLDQRRTQTVQQREQLLTKYRALRHQEFSLRLRRCEEVVARLGDRLRLDVEFKGDKEAYRRSLTTLFRGSGVNSSALDALAEPTPTDGAAIVEAVAKNELQKHFEGVTRAMAQRVADWLEEDARRFELELLTPADRMRIELVIDGQSRSLERLSLGQRATAVLLLLFGMEGRPLVLDQPEDDLDNRFVYEDVVALLRETKGTADPTRRQIIAATHNANIPVLGDAELVLSLEAHDERAQIIDRGSIDAVPTRERIRAILEGGEEAFRRRQEKYGGI